MSFTTPVELLLTSVGSDGAILIRHSGRKIRKSLRFRKQQGQDSHPKEQLEENRTTPHVRDKIITGEGDTVPLL
jgi:hypothetical protein